MLIFAIILFLLTEYMHTCSNIVYFKNKFQVNFIYFSLDIWQIAIQSFRYDTITLFTAGARAL